MVGILIASIASIALILIGIIIFAPAEEIGAERPKLLPRSVVNARYVDSHDFLFPPAANGANAGIVQHNFLQQRNDVIGGDNRIRRIVRRGVCAAELRKIADLREHSLLINRRGGPAILKRCCCG